MNLEAFTIESMYRILLVMLVLTLIAAAPRRPEIVTIPAGEPFEMRAGGKVEFPLNLKILKGFHIQSNPASEEYLIATTVKLEPTEGITPDAPIYPKGIAFRIKGSEKEITTYENEIAIKIPIQADTSASTGDRILKGTVRYQGCDATTCFPPTILPFEVKLIVAR